MRANPITCVLRVAISGLLALSVETALADFVSPFPSEIPGLDIPNASALRMKNGKPLLLRAMDPTRSPEHLTQLRDTFGVKDVIVFKNSPSNNPADTDDIKRKLMSAQITPHHIDMPYKNFNYQDGCRLTIDALQKIKELNGAGKPVLFHCTVGEDRTGLLAGVVRLLDRTKVDEDGVFEVFRDEMCKHGYEAANPEKANKSDGKGGAYEGSTFEQVVLPIRTELTPIYLALAISIMNGQFSWNRLDAALCTQNAPTRSIKKHFMVLEAFKCEPRDPRSGLIVK